MQSFSHEDKYRLTFKTYLYCIISSIIVLLLIVNSKYDLKVYNTAIIINSLWSFFTNIIIYK